MCFLVDTLPLVLVYSDLEPSKKATNKSCCTAMFPEYNDSGTSVFHFRGLVRLDHVQELVMIGANDGVLSTKAMFGIKRDCTFICTLDVQSDFVVGPLAANIPRGRS